MTDKQPEALRLAENLGKTWTLVSDQNKAAAELRRLHEVNAKLMDAMVDIDMSGIRYKETPVETVGRMRGIARAALAKATREHALKRLNKAAEDNGEEL